MKSDASNPYGAVFFLLPHHEFVQQETTLHMCCYLSPAFCFWSAGLSKGCHSNRMLEGWLTPFWKHSMERNAFGVNNYSAIELLDIYSLSVNCVAGAALSVRNTLLNKWDKHPPCLYGTYIYVPWCPSAVWPWPLWVWCLFWSIRRMMLTSWSVELTHGTVPGTF